MGGDRERDQIERELQERASRGGLEGGVREADARRLANALHSVDAERAIEREELRKQLPLIRARLILAGVCGIVALLIITRMLLGNTPGAREVEATPIATTAPSVAPAQTAAPTPIASAAASASGRAIVCGLPGGPTCPPRP